MTENKWESFAKANPYWYLLAPFNGTIDEFWETGIRQAKEIFFEVKDFLHNHNTVIEIGCGAGRCLIPMGYYFNECIGVDISKKMLELLEKNAEKNGVRNGVKCFLPTAPWYEHKADFIFSVKTLPCIEDFDVIEDYICKIHESLYDDGLVYLQFDTRPKTLMYLVKNNLPDFALPKYWQRGIRRIRRDRALINQLFEKYGFSTIKEENKNTWKHIFLLTKKPIKQAAII